jgi:hypothetical protein
MADSGAWKGGERLEMMEGVRRRSLGGRGGPGGGGAYGEMWPWTGGACGGVVRRGRNAWARSTGCRSRVLRRSEMWLGEIVAIGAEG